MALVCWEIVERIEETVWEPVEEWVERREKKCKKKKCKKVCLCCNKWFCWIETFLEKVVTWVAKQVVNFVTRTVCEIVHDLLKALWDTIVATTKIAIDVARILWNVLTWDWQDVKDAWKDLVADLADLGTAILEWVKIGVRIATLGYVAGYIREQIEQDLLKKYIRKKLNNQFGNDPDRLAAIKEAINLDHGAFGLEFDATSTRTFVDSLTGPQGVPPTLFSLHQAGQTDLYELAGVNVGNYLDRPRVEATLVDSGDPVEEDDIDDYLASKGQHPHFRIYAFNRSAQTEKLDVARDKGRQIGIKFDWTRATREVTGVNQMNVDRSQLDAFLANVLGRSLDGSDVCRLIAGGVFNLTDPASGRHPFGWTKWYSPASPLSGIAHRDRLPPEFMKYVLIHECGHYFSLEHAGHNGLDKIMFSPVESDWWSANLIFEFLWWSGEPRFTLGDGKKVWDFLIDTIPNCLPGGVRGTRTVGTRAIP